MARLAFEGTVEAADRGTPGAGVTVERGEEERTVDVPDDLLAALEAACVRERFDKLSYSHRREHVLAVVEAKRAETRQRRIQKAVEMVAAQPDRKR